MDSIVPIIASDVLEKDEGLRARVKYIIEQEFGHELRFVNSGSVFALHRADPLKTLVPFTVAISGTVNPLLKEDIFGQTQKLFPSSISIEATASELPQILESRAQELSLGRVNSASPVIRKVVSSIYKNLSRFGYNLSMIAHDNGISRSSLERECARNGMHGAAHLMKRIKMLEAERMLRETQADISEIAFAVGFRDLAVFDRSFIRAWGRSPSELRRYAKTLVQNAK